MRRVIRQARSLRMLLLALHIRNECLGGTLLGEEVQVLCGGYPLTQFVLFRGCFLPLPFDARILNGATMLPLSF